MAKYIVKRGQVKFNGEWLGEGKSLDLTPEQAEDIKHNLANAEEWAALKDEKDAKARVAAAKEKKPDPAKEKKPA